MNFYDEKPTVTEEPFVDLVKDLRDESMTLIRQQIELAKTEMSEKASRSARNGAYLAVGGLIAYAGFIYLLQFLNWGGRQLLQLWGVSQDVTLWLMPLILGVVVAVTGYIFIQKAISTFKRMSLTPDRTVHSIQEDQQWLKKDQQ
jgi:hypothetical protein